MTACLGRQLADLADGRLVGAARERALAHVAACASCREALAVQRGMRDLLGSTAVPEPTGDFLNRLRQTPPAAEVPELPVTTAGRSLAHQRTARHRRRVIAGGMSALVTTAAMAGVVTSLSQTAAAAPPPTVVPSLSSFAADHASAVGLLPVGGPALAGPSAGPPSIRVAYASQDLPPVPSQR